MNGGEMSLLKKFIVAYLASRYPAFMDPKELIWCSQKSTIGLHPGPVELRPHPSPYISNIYYQYYPHIYVQSPKGSCFSSFDDNFFMLFSSLTQYSYWAEWPGNRVRFFAGTEICLFYTASRSALDTHRVTPLALYAICLLDIIILIIHN
jgi:hypothetical protein